MITTAIFDLDGTLLDSTAMWLGLGTRYVRDIGKTPAPDLGKRLWELSLKDAVRLIKSEYEPPFSESEIIGQLTKMCGEFYRSEVRPKYGARELLERLSERGIGMRVLTSSAETLARAALERLGLIEFFVEIIGSADKTSPEAFLEAGALLKPNKTLVFEDALYAVKSAKAAGFITCAVYDPAEKNAEELIETADFYEYQMMDYAENIDGVLGSTNFKFK